MTYMASSRYLDIVYSSKLMVVLTCIQTCLSALLVIPRSASSDCGIRRKAGPLEDGSAGAARQHGLRLLTCYFLHLERTARLILSFCAAGKEAAQRR